MTARTLTLAAALSAAAAAPAAAADRGKDRVADLFAGVTARAAESTVRVRVSGRDAALGTVVSSDGLVATKGSELFDGRGKVRGSLSCVLADGRRFAATLKGYDRDTDLALLQTSAAVLVPVTFADPKAVAVGHLVAAPGADGKPAGVGVVSAGPRKLYLAEAVVENANKGYLGIELGPHDDDDDGVAVRGVRPRLAAAQAGMAADDVIRELAGRPIRTRRELFEELEQYRPGEVVSVRVRRGDRDVALKVRLGPREEMSRGDRQNAMSVVDGPDGRKVRVPLSGRRGGFPKVIQHDTVLYPSDCGGPLVDLDGRVIGLNIARAGRVETWALPGDVVAKAVRALTGGERLSPVRK